MSSSDHTTGAGRVRSVMGALSLALIVVLSGCGAPSPTGESAGPSGSSATSDQPISSDGPSPASSPTDDPAALPAPILGSVDEIVAAMSDPAQAEQVVVSMLDLLGIGLYNPDGTAIRVGTETSDEDFYLFEPEARGLAIMIQDRADPELSISFRDFHAAVALLGYQGSAEELARAYAESFADEPDRLVSRLVAATTSIDVDGRLTAFGAWLLVLDDLLRPSAAATAFAMVPAPVTKTVAWDPNWGAGRSLAQGNAHLKPQDARIIAWLMAITMTWTVQISYYAPAPPHEGHGGPGSILQFEARASAAIAGSTSPFSGNVVLPINPGGAGSAGIGVTWTLDDAGSRHGTITQAARTDASGRAEAFYRPNEESANGDGYETREDVVVEVAMSKLELATHLVGGWVAPYAFFLLGSASGRAEFPVEWHEENLSPIEITWVDVYDGVEDKFTFTGDLTTIDPQSVGGEPVYLGTGTVTGDRGGWVACNPGIVGVPTGPAPAVFAGSVKDGMITILAWGEWGGGLEGVNSAPMTVPLVGGTTDFAPTPPAGELCPHYSYGGMTVWALNLPTP